MKNFKIAQPQTIDQVTALLAETKGNSHLMAGGSDLLDEIKNGIITPDVVIDLKTVPGLDSITQDGDGVHIGALTSVAALAESPVIREHCAGLTEAALSLATPQLRNMGTVGGNLCQRPRCWYYRDPQVQCRKKGGSRCYAFRGRNKYHAILGGGLCYIVFPSDLAPALISLGTRVTLASLKGEKTLPLEDFFALPQANVRRENILESGQMLREIVIPPAKDRKSTYLKLKERGTWDFAVVSAAVSGVVTGSVVQDIRIVMGGVAPVPWRLKAAENLVNGKKISEALLREGVRLDMKDAKPLEENGFKTELAEVVVYRAALSLV